MAGESTHTYPTDTYVVSGYQVLLGCLRGNPKSSALCKLLTAGLTPDGKNFASRRGPAGPN